MLKRSCISTVLMNTAPGRLPGNIRGESMQIIMSEVEFIIVGTAAVAGFAWLALKVAYDMKISKKYKFTVEEVE